MLIIPDKETGTLMVNKYTSTFNSRAFGICYMIFLKLKNWNLLQFYRKHNEILL
jgi:hypothetical protein